MISMQWLTNERRWAWLAAWAVEVAVGMFVMYRFDKLEPRSICGLIIGSGVLVHYLHLLVKRYRLGEVPTAIITAWVRVANGRGQNGLTQEQLIKWAEVIERFDRKGMSRDFITDLERELRKLVVPRQLEFIFSRSLRLEVQRMVDLAQQRAVEDVDRRKQYDYAGSLAEYFQVEGRGHVSTIYATAFDTPSEFLDKHKDYFLKQQEFSTSTDGFQSFLRAEQTNLTSILLKPDDHRPKEGEEYPLAEMARIVIIKKEKLLTELGEPKFWDFVRLNASNKFALKFFVRDQDQGQEGYDEIWYEKKLKAETGAEEMKETIDDFIVYGTECVFGRIDPKADAGPVALRFYHAKLGNSDPDSRRVKDYKRFFQLIWTDERPEGERRSHTLTELWWDLPETRVTMRKKRDQLENILRQYTALLQHRLGPRGAPPQ